jgi:selenoprotein W-related protein
LPKASGLAAVIKEKTGAAVELIRGGAGIYDIKVDGRLVYSKHQTGRFPEDHEILAHLEK